MPHAIPGTKNSAISACTDVIPSQWPLPADTRRLVKIAQLTGAAHLAQLKGLNRSDNLWGFPHFFAPGQYGPDEVERRRKMHAAEVKREAHELTHMRHEENEQRGVDRVCLERVVSSDLRKFKQAIDCYGGLNTSLFYRTVLIGMVYEQVVYKSAARIALWWLVIYPPFLQRREDAATNIAKVWRGHLWGRRIYREEFAVAFSLRVKARRNLGVCLSEWIGTTEVVRTARRFFQRIQRQHTMVIFAAWPTYCRLMEKEREAKLEYAKGKLKERKIRVTFAAWAADTQVIRNTKKFVAEMMSGQATKAFRNWQKFVARRVLIRGALQIQRIVRGRLARRRVSLRRTRLTFIAVVFQGFFWAQRARKAVVARQQEVDKERAITAKGDRRSRQHREHERLITEHEMWKERKELYQEEAAADARRTLDDEMATKKGLKELAKKARAAR